MPKKKITTEERELKVFYPKWMEDQPWPELLSYKNLVVKPEELKDINGAEGAKLAGIEEGANNLSLHNTDDLPQGATHLYDDKDASARAKAGLTASGFVQQVIRGSNLSGDPATGLNMTSQYVGYYNGTTWPVYIKNDGKFMFQGDSGNYITWNGSVLNVRGQLNADDITAGTLTGRKVRTASSGRRVELETSGDYANHIILYGSDGYQKLSIYENIIAWNTNPWIISTDTDKLEIRFPVPIADIRSLFFTRGTRADVKVYGGPGSDIEVPTLIPSSTYDLGSSSYKWRNLYLSGNLYCGYVGNSLLPASSSYNLGSSSYNWNYLYTYGIYLNGTLRTSWPSAGISKLSELSIDTSKNWGGYGISNLGTIYPSYVYVTNSLNCEGKLNANVSSSYSYNIIGNGAMIGNKDVGKTNSYDLLPYGDNYGQIGYRSGYGGQGSNRRWSGIYGVTMVSGDYCFDNKFKMTEEGKSGIAFFNPKNKKIAILDEKGNLYVKGKIFEKNNL